MLALDLARARRRRADWRGACGATQLEPQFIVNNAGFGLVGRAAALDRGEQLGMIDLNVRALTDLSLSFIDSLERHRGGILNVASVAGFLPGPGSAVYYAGKAFVLSLTEALHEELAPRGIRVTCLCPGPVATEFQARAGIAEAAPPWPLGGLGDPRGRSRLSRTDARAAGRAARLGQQAGRRAGAAIDAARASCWRSSTPGSSSAAPNAALMRRHIGSAPTVLQSRINRIGVDWHADCLVSWHEFTVPMSFIARCALRS